jgi:hypothetical protein
LKLPPLYHPPPAHSQAIDIINIFDRTKVVRLKVDQRLMKLMNFTILFWVLAVLSLPANSQDFDAQLAGRISDSSGVPRTGPIDLEIKFFPSDTGGSQLGSTVFKESIALSQGMFSVMLELSSSEKSKIFGSGKNVWVEFTDATNQQTYPRQLFSAVPYAMRIPVNGDSLSFNSDGELTIDAAKLDASKFDVSKMDLTKNDGTVNIGADSGNGKVELKADPSANYVLKLPADDGSVGDLLQTDGDGNLTWTSSGGANSNAGTLCNPGEYLDGDGSCKTVPAIANADTICNTGEYLDGDGSCRTNAYIVTNGGGLTGETDPNVAAFAKAALPTCGAGQVLKGDGTNLTCVADAGLSVESDPNVSGFAKAALPTCGAGQVLKGDGTNLTCVADGGLTVESDPNVTGFAKAALPSCGAGQVLKGDGTSLSCVADGGLTAETDPNVTGFAKAALPNCGAGEVLKGDGTNLSCVADGGLTSETDPNVTAFAKAALPTCVAGEVLKGDGTNLSCVTDADSATNWIAPGTIGSTTPNSGVFTNLTAESDLKIKDGDTHFVTIIANADADYTLTLPVDDGTNNQVLKTDGNGVLSWTNAGADTNAQTQCGTSEYLDGDGTCRTESYIVTTGGGLTAETDPNVTAFAKAALPTCGAGEVLKGDGTNLSCVSDAGITSETDPNVTGFAKAALPTCGAGEVLKGDGTNLSCVSDAGITSETDPNVTGFAKAALPTCGAGEVLKGDGTNLSCVSDTGITLETDPNVTAFAKAALPTCGAGEVLKGDGTNLSCVSDTGITSESDPQIGTITTNYVPRWNSSALVTGSIFDNGTAVGIGTTGPDVSLDIRGAMDLENPGETVQIRINPASSTPLIGTKTNHHLNLISNDTPRITLMAGGNVGIGTSNPLTATQIGPAYALTPGDIDVAAYQSSIYSQTNIGGLLVTGSGTGGALGNEALRVHLNSTGAYDVMRVSSNNGDIMVANGNGNIGVGTTDPSTKIHVKDASGNATIFLEDTGSTGANVLLKTSSHQYNVSSDSGGNFQIYDNDNTITRFLIEPAGDVGIGVTNPTAKLHVGGTAGVDGIKFPDGSLQTSAASAMGLRDAARNLQAKNGSSSDTEVDITADEIILQNAVGTPYRATSVNVTAAITGSGANGLDTGSEASSTWYHIWVIYDGTTIASLLSTSATTPTMPGAYTYKAYIGAVFNDSGSDFIQFNQFGKTVRREELKVLSNGTTTSYTALTLSDAVPSTAKFIAGRGGLNTATDGTNYEGLYLRPISSNTVGQVKMIEYAEVGGLFDPADGPQWEYQAMLVSPQTLYYRCYSYRASSGANNCGNGQTAVEVWVSGWEY